MPAEDLTVQRQMEDVKDFEEALHRFEVARISLTHTLLSLNTAVDALGEATVALAQIHDLDGSVHLTASDIHRSLRRFREGDAYFTLNEVVHSDVSVPCKELHASAKRVLASGKQHKAAAKKASAVSPKSHEVTYQRDYSRLLRECNALLPPAWKAMLMATSQFALALSSSLLSSYRVVETHRHSLCEEDEQAAMAAVTHRALLEKQRRASAVRALPPISEEHYGNPHTVPALCSVSSRGLSDTPSPRHNVEFHKGK